MKNPSFEYPSIPMEGRNPDDPGKDLKFHEEAWRLDATERVLGDVAEKRDWALVIAQLEALATVRPLEAAEAYRDLMLHYPDHKEVKMWEARAAALERQK